MAIISVKNPYLPTGWLALFLGRASYAAFKKFRGIPGMTGVGVRRAKAAFLSGCKSHSAILLQPEAIGAVMEVTKWLKPSV